VVSWPRLGRAGLAVAYPIAIYVALQWFEPRFIALTLAVLVLVQQRERAGRMLDGLAPAVWTGAAVLVILSVATWLVNDERVLRLWPVGMNVSLLLVFAGSLLRPPPMIERFARLLHPGLPPEGVRYTRRVTQVWCAFFVLNGAIAAYTAIATSRETWVIYNGLIAYLLVGALFCGEWLVRRRLLASARS
jgi:uncharacterized membrane protein